MRPRPRAGSLTIDNRYLPPLLITSILLAAHLSFGILEGYDAHGAGDRTAIGAEMVMGRLTYGKWPHPASAYITGISVGILVRSPCLWPYFLSSLISITSKYVLRVKGRHLWNPSNFGVSALLFLAPATVTVLSIQWGNVVAPMAVIWISARSSSGASAALHISATYVASFLLFSFVRSVDHRHAVAATVAPITGPMYQLFIFFMVTDPKTTVRSTAGGSASSSSWSRSWRCCCGWPRSSTRRSTRSSSSGRLRCWWRSGWSRVVASGFSRTS